jgi:predicted nucleotide-binding protein
MTRPRSSPYADVPALLTVPREQFAEEIGERIRLGAELAQREVPTPDELEAAQSDFYTWGDFNKEFLRRRFTTPEIADEYARVAPFTVGGRISFAEDVAEFRERVGEKVRRLDSVKERIPLFEESPQVQAASGAVRKPRDAAEIESIFIVHGHDEGLKLAVHGFLRDVTDIDPVILHDQPSRGRTVLEKFEAVGSAAGYAIVLLSKDDVGGAAEESELRPRARQNVVWEFGFFAGAIGRSHVAVLYEEGVELPSDLHGLVYIPVDDGGGWKLLLARELKDAGIHLNAEKLI